MENHHAFNGKIHYFDWAIFHCFLYVHQRVGYFIAIAMERQEISELSQALGPNLRQARKRASILAEEAFGSLAEHFMDHGGN